MELSAQVAGGCWDNPLSLRVVVTGLCFCPFADLAHLDQCGTLYLTEVERPHYLVIRCHVGSSHVHRIQKSYKLAGGQIAKGQLADLEHRRT